MSKRGKKISLSTLENGMVDFGFLGADQFEQNTAIVCCCFSLQVKFLDSVHWYMNACECLACTYMDKCHQRETVILRATL